MPILGLSGTGKHRFPLRLLKDRCAEGGLLRTLARLTDIFGPRRRALTSGRGTAFFPAMDMDGSTRRDQMGQFYNVLIVHADTAVGDIGSDALGWSVP